MTEPGRVYEITSRTLREEMRLRPSAEINAIVLGVFGRALFLFPEVMLHYFIVLSDHMHWLASASDGDSLRQFIAFVKSNIARRVADLDGVGGRFWARRASVIPVVDEGAMIDRLRYELSNGTKEGLVASPADWPGASGYEALVGDMTLKGVWHDKTAENRARRSKRPVDPAQFRETYDARLTPLPAFANLDAAALRERHAELARAVTVEAERTNEALDRRPLGADVVTAQDPMSRPMTVKRSPAPLCHASTPEAREAFKKDYDTFVAEYRASAQALREGRQRAFPPGSFPSGGCWVAFSRPDEGPIASPTSPRLRWHRGAAGSGVRLAEQVQREELGGELTARVGDRLRREADATQEAGP
jgi:hypothetical protein